MAERDKLYMGIDIGSVSLNIAIVDEQVKLLESVYQRTMGQPIPVLLDAFATLAKKYPKVDGVVATGSGRELVSDVFDVHKENEIITQAKALTHFHPETSSTCHRRSSLNVDVTWEQLVRDCIDKHPCGVLHLPVMCQICIRYHTYLHRVEFNDLALQYLIPPTSQINHCGNHV